GRGGGGFRGGGGGGRGLQVVWGVASVEGIYRLEHGKVKHRGRSKRRWWGKTVPGYTRATAFSSQSVMILPAAAVIGAVNSTASNIHPCLASIAPPLAKLS